MSIQRTKRESGFTVLELGVVVLVAGVVFAIATPKFVNAMREYRVSMASRQLADLIHRAKTQAVADNRRVAIRIDTANRKAGVVVYNDNGDEIRTEYIPLPQGVSFTRPTNAGAPVSGAPADRDVSFGLKQGSNTIYEQQFSPRGFPVVNSPTTIQALYVGNGRNFRAVTLTSVGGIRSWKWNNSQWVNTRANSSTTSGGGGTPTGH